MHKYLNRYLSSKTSIFIILVLLALINGTIFGLNEIPLTGDPVSYNSYAINLALGNGYHLYDAGFSIYREPAYSFFISIVYRIFGVENFIAVKIVQMLLVVGISFFIYLSFEHLNYKNTGLVAAILTSAIPYFGYYANMLMSELFFAFFIAISFYLLLRILNGDSKLLLYILLGLAFGIATLTKSVLLFSPVFVALIIFYFRKDLHGALCFLAVFILCIGAWIGYVHKNTGSFAITDGRLDIHIYTRAKRSTLSYKDQVYYLYSWISRSALGGKENDILLKYEEKPLIKEYAQRLNNGESKNNIEKEGIKTIINNPGHYLFGNTIELIKLLSIEHLYPPVPYLLNRIFRLLFYIFLYSFSVWGTFKFINNGQKGPKIIFWLALFYLAYNWATISSVDAVSRFNTPYLYLYLIIGIVGFADIFDKKLANRSF